MNHTSRVLALVLMIAVLKCAVADSLPKVDSETLDVKTTIARKESLFGTQVAVRGYLVLYFENINLYQSRKDSKLNNRRCVTIGVNDFFRQEGKKHNHKMVVIRGQLKPDYVEKNAICLSYCSRYAVLPDAINVK